MPPSYQAGSITQQSAEDATFRQSGVDVESAHSAGLIPPVNSALVRAFANHTLLAKETIGTASRTLNARPGFPCDGVNREPRREEAADDKWAAAFYECGIAFEVASSEPFRANCSSARR